MVGKKRTPELPAWFDPTAYHAASGLDAGDWLLNLALRRWLCGGASPQTEASLRQVGPVLRRGDDPQVKRMHLADCHRWVASFNSTEWEDPFEALQETRTRPTLPSDVRDALRTGRVPSGVNPLRVDHLYMFERRLPAEVRKAGATFTPGDSLAIYPSAFGGTLDDAFGPGPAQQMTGRFLLVDLTLPDDVLHADLSRYLATERKRLASMGGRQPYREAASLKLKPNAQTLQTFSAVGLLPFLDLDRWQRAEVLGLSFSKVRDLAGVDKDREKELRSRVALVMNQMQLHAWFARLERSATVRFRRGRSAG